MSYLLVLLTVFSSAVFAEGRLDCVSDPDTPTYQLQRKDENTFVLNVHFPGQAIAAPVWSGDVSLANLEWINYKASIVKKLGSTYRLEFPAQQCLRRKHESGLYDIHCFIRGEGSINGVNFKGLSFHASTRRIQSLSVVAGTATPVTDDEAIVGVEIGFPQGSSKVQYLDFSRSYSASECRSNDEFWK